MAADPGTLLSLAMSHALAYRLALAEDSRPPSADYNAMLERFTEPMPEQGTAEGEVIEALATQAMPGLMPMAGPRFFGWVIGASHPAGVAADWLVSAWGQNTGYHSPTQALMRDHLQVGNYIRAGFLALNTNNGQQITGYSTAVPWPNGPDYGLILHPVYLRHESPGHLRGKMPGIFWVHNDSPMADLNIVSGVTGYPGRKFLIVLSGYSTAGNVARYAFDITGPWW